jgi:hypothetical protein
MNKIIFSIFIIFLNIFALGQDRKDEFIEALINNSVNIEQYIKENELEKSKRLGISYDGVKYKFMISYDIDEKIKDEVKKNGLKYDINKTDLGNGYSLIDFTVPSLNYSKKFYFKNGKWISPITYFSKDWTTKTSKYFIFKLSEPKYFNDYCINKLDEFVDSISVLLEFTEQEKKLLEEEKIYYLLCKDDKEIEQVTGFNTRGIYITAFDEVVTTYNTHYHELAHLLMNYKLKNLSLYTLPFFMEGFAVAIGGRGGMAKGVVLDIGYYLQKSGFLTYDSIITNDGFYKEDASLTYPVAGLYNAFLMDFLGMKEYLTIYKLANGSFEYIRNLKFQDDILKGELFGKFIEHYYKYSKIVIDSFIIDMKCVGLAGTGGMCVFDTIYGFFINNEEKKILVGDFDFMKSVWQTKYFSKVYLQYFNDTLSNDSWHQYLIVCDYGNISIYNCFTNELIDTYNQSFVIDSKQVPFFNNKYYFCVRKNIFDSDFKHFTLCCGKF